MVIVTWHRFLVIACYASSVVLCTTARNCRKINSCKCEMDDGSGIINLRSLAHPGNLPKWTLGGGDGWMYKYNPCLGYAMGVNTGLAVAQASTIGTTYDLGIQTSANFNITDEDEVCITYLAKNKERSSRVILKCDRETRFDSLEFIGEIRITEYDFILTSPCACPGYCDNSGLYEHIAMNMSGYWENRYGGQRSFDVVEPQPVSGGYPWSEVGIVFSSLIFHDLVLIVVIASLLLVYRHLRKCKLRSWSSKSSGSDSASEQQLFPRVQEA